MRHMEEDVGNRVYGKKIKVMKDLSNEKPTRTKRIFSEAQWDRLSKRLKEESLIREDIQKVKKIV